MSAHELAVWAAWVLFSALVLLIAGYAVFAPALGRLNGELYDKQSAALAEAEAKRWKAYRADGVWPEELPVAKRVDRIAAKMREPLHRLKVRNDKTGADK
jgi:hypothetical protein